MGELVRVDFDEISKQSFSVKGKLFSFVLIATASVALVSGCAATRFSAAERIETVFLEETLVDSFHVEDLDGNVKTELKRGSAPVRISKTKVNRLLEQRFPRSFNNSWNSIPLHVSCSGMIPVSPVEKDDWSWPNCLDMAASFVFYRHCDNGMLNVEIRFGDNGETARCPVAYFRSHTRSFLSPLAAVVPGRGDWRTIWTFYPNGEDCVDVLADLVAVGIVKALNGMDARQIGSLRSQRHLTEGQRKALQALEAGATTTVAVRQTDSGPVFVESVNEYVVTPVDAAARLRLPSFVKQCFDAESRIGMVSAYVSGCDPQRTQEYLVGKLIPAICGTKNVVFALSEGPAAGAEFEIIEDRTGEDHVRTIRFKTLQ